MEHIRFQLSHAVRVLAAHWIGYTIAVLPVAILMGIIVGGVVGNMVPILSANGAETSFDIPTWQLIGLTAGRITLILGCSLALISALFDFLIPARRQRTKRRHIIGVTLTTLVVVGLGGAAGTHGGMIVALPALAISGALGGLIRWRLFPRDLSPWPMPGDKKA